jgi:hypothetical protein
MDVLIFARGDKAAVREEARREGVDIPVAIISFDSLALPLELGAHCPLCGLNVAKHIAVEVAGRDG